MVRTKKLSASLEDYLEAIFHIAAQKQAAKAKDIARRLKVSSSSVTGALHALAEKGLINYAPYDLITLTAAGKAAAGKIIRRHEVLRNFFVRVMAVEKNAAEEAACRMEHVISQDILERLVQFVDFVETCPRGGAEWLEGFSYRCQHGKNKDECEQCLTTCLENWKKQRTRREMNS